MISQCQLLEQQSIQKWPAQDHGGLTEGWDPSHVRKVILFHNTMWGSPLDYPAEAIPTPYLLTTDRLAAGEAVAVVFHLPTLSSATILQEIPKRKGQLWVLWCMECEANYPQMNDREFLASFDLTMTYRLDSDVAVTYLDPGFPEALRREPAGKADGKLLNSFISSPYNQSGRIEFLMQLMSYVDVHCYGKLFRNTPIACDRGRATKLDTIKAYKFTLAFENAFGKDYVTEKFYDPLVAGSVPVYLGAPNIDDFAPGDHCFINAADWDSPAALGRYLTEIADNESRYLSYFKWKTKPFRARFSELLEMNREHCFVRLCRKVDERLRQRP